jgi:hypothetical protein
VYDGPFPVSCLSEFYNARIERYHGYTHCCGEGAIQRHLQLSDLLYCASQLFAL